MEILKLMRENERFLIISHSRPDGDAIGSSAALYELLKRLRKYAVVSNASPIPEKYSYLHSYKEFTKLENTKETFDVVFILDTPDLSLIKERFSPYNLGKTVVNIDHHKDNKMFGDYNIVDIKASAVGEIIYKIGIVFFHPLPQDIAEAIYTAILTDTGMFSYSNTTPQTHIIASELLKTGINAPFIAQKLFKEKSFQGQKLIGKMLSNMDKTPGGHAVYSVLTLKELKETGATENDMENIVDYLNNIKGSEASFLIREIKKNVWKLSFRSHNIDISKIATSLGGGGHKNAAGAEIEGKLKDIIKLISRKVDECIDEYYSKHI